MFGFRNNDNWPILQRILCWRSNADVRLLDSNCRVGRRWAKHRELDALKRAALPDALQAPGSLVAKYPLEIVQVDHTQADVLLVSEYDRRIIGRPWLTSL